MFGRGARYVCRSCQRSLPVKRRKGVENGLRRYATANTRQHPLHLAIIGSGPAGFYSAYRLLKALPDARVDMYEGLPSPYGLVRFGIAPDHPEAKKCSETLPDVAKYPGFNYIGNVPIGEDEGQLPLTTIAPHYDGILFAYGASKDKRLGIPGEDLKGVHSARAFVGWYNGLPEYADLNPELDAGDTAVVIGQGNVALDVTRVLFMPLGELRKTDISEHALEALSKSRVRDVKIIGRRGPLQAPYTIKELRELMNIHGLGFVPPPEGWEALLQVEPKKLPRQLKRIMEVLMKGSKTPIDKADSAWQLGYLRSPIEFLSKDSTSLAAVGFEQQEYIKPMTELLTGEPQNDLNTLRAAKVRGTGQKGMVSASLAFRSIGYESTPLPGFDQLGVPFDTKKGIIPNDRWGRVLSPSRGPGGDLTAGHVPGMYCAGWVKRGPTGVIASTLDDAFTSADVIVKDWQKNVRFLGDEDGVAEKRGWEEVKKEVESRGIRWVSWKDWEVIDAEEQRRGKEKGKEREKCRSVAEMLRILDG